MFEFPSADVSHDLREKLQAESEHRRPQADLLVIRRFSLDEDGALRGKRNTYAVGPGPVLDNLFLGAGLELAQIAAKTSVFPTRASYLFYDQGCQTHLHHDITQCVVTILLSLTRGAEPLVIYPQLGKVSPRDVDMFNSVSSDERFSFEREVGAVIGVNRMAGIGLPIVPDSMVAITGRDVAHARYPSKSSVTVASMCYAPLVHRPRW